MKLGAWRESKHCHRVAADVLLQHTVADLLHSSLGGVVDPDKHSVLVHLGDLQISCGTTHTRGTHDLIGLELIVCINKSFFVYT